MKSRILVFLAVFLVVGATAFAAANLPPWMLEPPGTGPGSANPQWSLSRATSFDVFAGPFDAMFNLLTIGAGPTFLTLQTPMVAGGLDNLLLGTATAPAVNGPVYAGYFNPGKNPLSLYAELQATGAGAEPATSTTNVNAAKVAGSTTYTWVTGSSVSNNNVRPFLSTNDAVQGLVGLSSSMATGAALGFTMTDNATAAANYTLKQTAYYDTAGAGVAPSPAVDYTLTTTASNAGGTNYSLALSVPFLFKAGNTSHFANVQVLYGAVDNGTSVTQTETAKQTAGAVTYTNQANKLVSNAGIFAVLGSYAMMLPPIFSKGANDKFIADVDFNVTFAGQQYNDTVNQATYTNPGGGGAPAASAGLTSTTVTDTYSPGIGWKLGAGAIHSFYFAPASGIQLGVVPSVYADYSMSVLDAGLTGETSSVLTDVNNNGVQDAGDTILHTTIAWTNANGSNGVGTAASSTGTLEVFASLPVAIVIKPAGWIFGFTLGTAPTLLFQNASTYTYSMTESTTTYTETVGGASTTPATVQTAPTDPSTSVTNAWTFTAQHALSLNFDFGGVTMDVILNLLNLFQFDNLKIQVNAPLK